ncbi:MAG TPA: PPOX class F420-dependent oxidoreductase [Microlunatus sp.]
MSVRTTPDPWAGVRGQRAVMLTTCRRDGRAVATPVGYGIDGPTLYFMTDPGTGKVKRLRHTAAVTLAASTLRGAVKGPALAGVATEVTGAEAERGRRQITATNRLAWFLLLRKARRAGWDWVVYAVRRDATDGTIENDHVDDDTEHTDIQETS